MASFTQYWEVRSCLNESDKGNENKPLEHTAGDLFKKRGVAPGDRVYIVNIDRGILYLIGRLEVDKFVSFAEAQKLLGPDVWEDASEHLIAKPGSATPMHFARDVPLEITKQLLFHGVKGFQPLKFVGEDMLDRQALRGVRRLTEPSAHLLEKLLREDDRKTTKP